MKEKQILYFHSYQHLGILFTSYKSFLKLLSKNFKNIYIINIDNLRIFTKKQSYKISKITSKFPKKIKFLDPKNFSELGMVLKNKNNLIISNIGRGFENFPLLFFVARKGIPQISVHNSGNIQASIYRIFSHPFRYLKLIFTKFLALKIGVILTSLGVLSKIDIRFTSSKMLYRTFYQNKKKLIPKPSFYKDFILVKSQQFDQKTKKNNNNQKYITLLDFQVDWVNPRDPEMRKSPVKLNNKNINLHYKKLIGFLNLLKSRYKKKIVICIHPSYDKNKLSKIYKKFKVEKFKTREYIQKSFIVLFFDSSAIVDAIVLKKRIIALRSSLFFGKRYSSDIYTDRVNLKIVNISNKIEFNKKKFLEELDDRIKFYDEYLNEYSSMDLKDKGSQKIIDTIKEKYF